MVVISTRDFRTNQTKYLNLAKAGEHVVLKSRAGNFRIFPDDGSHSIDSSRDLMSGSPYWLIMLVSEEIMSCS
jgi:hypothetical protein